ncbi:MAG TPA: hypothetical protein VGO92_09675 [Acidimicrobiales bacterium]|jgi:hypothetical protein|nr:hypothetical protein [Acidimicrobiales bacterium]
MKQVLCLLAAVLGVVVATPVPSGATVLTLHTYDGPATGAFLYGATLAPGLPATIGVTMAIGAPAGLTTDQFGSASVAAESMLCTFTGDANESVEAGLSHPLNGACTSPSTGGFPCTASYGRVGVVVVVTGNCSYRKSLSLEAAMAWAPDPALNKASMVGLLHIGP